MEVEAPNPPARSIFTPLLVIILIVGAIGLAIYFKSDILDYLSLPEKVIEEEVKREVDSVKEKKVIEEEIEEDIVENYGYCYIGTDRNIRSCIKYKPGDKCMSGEIFPRRDICINPKLRA